MRAWIFLCLITLAAPFAYAEEKPIPRVLVALYDSRDESTPRPTQTHRFLEMPANHLGFDIHHYDVNAPLPKLGDDVAGVVLWFNTGNEVADAPKLLSWLEQAEAAGKKIVIIENGGIGDKLIKDPAIARRWNAILNYIGIDDEDRWMQITYHATVAHSDDVVGFEHRIGPSFPAFPAMHAIPGRATSHLQLRIQDIGQDDPYDIVITGSHGGYVAPDYAIHEEEAKPSDSGAQQQDTITLWLINPFLFLKESLVDGLSPVPDVTTLDGQRIFYSHIDGDGWNNVSEIPKYQKRHAISAEVILDEILKPYSDFAFNVGLIISDTLPDCYGVDSSERIARWMFELPNVEPSSHTWSHPLFWEFFENYDPAQEKRFLSLYPARPKNKFSMVETIKSTFSKDEWQEKAFATVTSEHTFSADAPLKLIKRGKNEDTIEDVFKKDYPTPRSYACSPFDLKQEILGSVATIDALAPKGKQARLVQWSGDTNPFEAALAMTHKAGLLNINGGNSRFDEEYPSYSCVSPIGIRIGNERQIYSSNSNEDTYTNLWTERFFGYRYLKVTVTNTEEPLRVSPFNIYFHIFSGEKQASLNALKENLAFARTQNIIPITASDYAAIAEGFYTTQITPAGPDTWHISNNGNLQTLRFDLAGNASVDWESSKGLLGQRYFQHSLYVALDPAAAEATIGLKKNESKEVLPQEKVPYLVGSRWQIRNLHIAPKNSGWTFTAQGYGNGDMIWKAEPKKEYLIRTLPSRDAKATAADQKVKASDDGTLTFTIDKAVAILPATIKVTAQ